MRCGSSQAVAAVLLAMSLLPTALQVVDAAEVESREISFQSATYGLKGTITRPIGQAVVGSVLIIPGSGPVDRDGASRMAPSLPPMYRQWAEQLSETGFVVLRYDKRFLTYPDIDIPSFDQEAQIADTLSALASLRSLLGPAPQPIFIIGHSEGGILASLVAERAGIIAGVAIINSILFPVDELLVAQVRAQPNMPRSMVEDIERRFAQIKNGSFPNHGLFLGAGRQYWAQWMAYSRRAPDTLSRLPIPLLLIQSLNDKTLPGETLERNLAVLRNVVSTKKNAQLRLLRDHDHLTILPNDHHSSPAFIRILLDWLIRESQAAQPDASGR